MYSKILGRLSINLKYGHVGRISAIRACATAVPLEKKPQQETLTERMINFLNIDLDTNKTSYNFVTDSRKIMNAISNNDVTYFENLNALEIVNFMHKLEKEGVLTEGSEGLRTLDMLCYKSADSYSSKDLLKLLGAFVHIVPNRITELKFYHKAIDTLGCSLREFDKNSIIQLLFYVGFQKKKVKNSHIIKQCLRCLNDEIIINLSSEELCIICNATFKTSTKINNKKLLEKVKGYLNDNLFLLKDPALFVTLVKTLRHNRYQDKDLLSTISHVMFFNKAIECYTFSTFCHILALYADYLYYDDTVLKYFTEKCVQELAQSKFLSKRLPMAEQLRTKDIKRFLWCLSNLNSKHLTNEDITNVVIPKILERIEGGEFQKDHLSLVEMFLYLWIMGYKAYTLVPYVFDKDALKSTFASQSPILLRLNLLLTLIYLEDRDLYRKIGFRPQGSHNFIFSQHLKQRPVLQRVYDNLNCLKFKLDVNKFEINYQIPYLHILGITGYKKNIYKAVQIEVLDDVTCVKNTEEAMPTGLMATKLRILEKQEEALLEISQEEIEAMTEAELQEYLTEELNLVC